MRRNDTPELATADGARHLVLARRHGIDVRNLTIDPVRLSPGGQKLVRRYRAGGVPVTRADVPHGVRFEFRPRWHELDRAGGLWLGVENLRSPGNLGTMLRTAAAAGVRGVVCLGSPGFGCADPWSPGAVRASMGAVFGLKLVRTNADHLRRWARRTGTRIIGTSAQSQREYHRVSWRGPAVVMMGHETKGLSASQRRACDAIVRIPMACEGSLNVATAAAVVLFEARRQRRPRRRAR